MDEMNEDVTNTSFIRDMSGLYTEDFSDGARGVFLLFGVLALFLNIPAIIVLRKTRKVPYSGKFLSSGLLAFDATFIFISTVRKFISSPMTNVTLQLLGTSANGLGVISLAMMAIERYVLFFYPMKYLTHVTDRLTRLLSCSIWVGYLFGHWFLRYAACYIKSQTVLVFMQAGFCNDFVIKYMMVWMSITTTVCIICYARIIAFVRKKSKAVSPFQPNAPTKKTLMLEYKSTMFVFMCTSVMCVSFIAYIIILALNVSRKITIEQNRIAYESVSLINCLLDPLWYVLWFKECRLEGLKILSICNQKLLPKAEKMRFEIFNIVTSDISKEKSLNNNSRISVQKHLARASDVYTEIGRQSNHRISETALKETQPIRIVTNSSQTRAVLRDVLILESIEGE